VLRYVSAILLVALVGLRPVRAGHANLHLIQFTSDTSAYHVGATLILGPTEAILVDAMMFPSDAKRVADSIAALGTHLKAIFITHPDEDHYWGAPTIVARFPGTPVYMTEKAITRFNVAAPKFLAEAKKNAPPSMSSLLPDQLPTPTPLPSTSLTVDGETCRPVGRRLWVRLTAQIIRFGQA
jgi:glyoxylase-like metal-dependent hydrolase (beta-lactamase superfamily II)